MPNAYSNGWALVDTCADISHQPLQAHAPPFSPPGGCTYVDHSAGTAQKESSGEGEREVRDGSPDSSYKPLEQAVPEAHSLLLSGWSLPHESPSGTGMTSWSPQG